MEYLNAFWVGGLICVIAQLLIDFTKLTPARILTGCVVVGVILSATGVFAPIEEYAGAGVNIPLLGFGNVMAQGVKRAVDINGPLGIITGGLAAASAGITVAIVLGLLSSLIGKSRQK